MDETTYEEFYKLAGEFFRMSKDATYEETENGHKCLVLSYFAIDPDSMNEMQKYQASIAIDLAGRTLIRKDPVAIKADAALRNMKRLIES